MWFLVEMVNREEPCRSGLAMTIDVITHTDVIASVDVITQSTAICTKLNKMNIQPANSQDFLNMMKWEG